METIGDRIKKLLKDKHMTHEELDRKADIPYATLIKIIGGSVDTPTVRTI
ncbi:MAG: hypothetical protein Kow0081_1770 [Candidatus Dojkabacteria bacterium]